MNSAMQHIFSVFLHNIKHVLSQKRDIIIYVILKKNKTRPKIKYFSLFENFRCFWIFFFFLNNQNNLRKQNNQKQKINMSSNNWKTPKVIDRNKFGNISIPRDRSSHMFWFLPQQRTIWSNVTNNTTNVIGRHKNIYSVL